MATAVSRGSAEGERERNRQTDIEGEEGESAQLFVARRLRKEDVAGCRMRQMMSPECQGV